MSDPAEGRSLPDRSARERFTIRWLTGRGYVVNVPNYEGGEVVSAESYDRLRAQNEELRGWLRENKSEAEKAWTHVEQLQAKIDDQRRRSEPDGAGGFRWEAADAQGHIVWLRNQMGDVRGMQTDGATPEEMDEALGRVLRGERARKTFDEARSARASDEQEAPGA